MKRLWTTIAITSALVAGVSPLAHAEGYAGFRLGANHSVFVGDGSEELSWSREGFSGGGHIGFDSGKHIGFRADFLYTMKGGGGPGMPVEVWYIDPDTVNWSYIKVDYLEFAPLLVARFPLSGRFSMRGFVGPTIGLWINAEEQITQILDGTEYTADIDIGDVVEHWEFSGTIGAELNAKAGPYVLLLEARYTQGSRIFESVGLDGEPLSIYVSNSGLRMMAGLSVPF